MGVKILLCSMQRYSQFFLNEVFIKLTLMNFRLRENCIVFQTIHEKNEASTLQLE